mgnify:FL=1|jgi:hypothetical protein
MADQKSQKFTEEELSLLKELQGRMDQLIIGLGQVSINKKALDERETQLTDTLKQIKAEETSLAQRLSKKYGKGTLDIESGEFTPQD